MLDPALLPALHDALVVAQTSSIGEAARRLHKTPSAVSQQLRRIEQHFDVHLFERVGRRIRPSPAGEAALGALTRVFDEASSLGTLLAELAGARVATLRIAASDYLGEALLVPVIRQLVEAKVPLHFEITTTHSTAATRLVADSQVDLAIVSAEREPAAGERTLFRQPFVWVGPRLRPAGRGLVARLAREPLLRLLPGSRGRRLLDEFLGRTGIRPASTIDMPSVSLMVSYASRGLGIGLAPALAVTGVDRRRVVVERAAVPDQDVRLLLRPGLQPADPVRRFLGRLAEEAGRAQQQLVGPGSRPRDAGAK
jgi:DNA-binding transcriptional LysR family regulator